MLLKWAVTDKSGESYVVWAEDKTSAQEEARRHGFESWRTVRLPGQIQDVSLHPDLYPERKVSR